VHESELEYVYLSRQGYAGDVILNFWLNDLPRDFSCLTMKNVDAWFTMTIREKLTLRLGGEKFTMIWREEDDKEKSGETKKGALL
jgi:hypothetical protein